MIKIKYITPLVTFEEFDPDNLCDEFGGSAHGQKGNDDSGTGWGGGKAKASDFSLDDEFVGPIEVANNDFEYYIDM